jgi:hypothetical protein
MTLSSPSVARASPRFVRRRCGAFLHVLRSSRRLWLLQEIVGRRTCSPASCGSDEVRAFDPRSGEVNGIALSPVRGCRREPRRAVAALTRSSRLIASSEPVREIVDRRRQSVCRACSPASRDQLRDDRGGRILLVRTRSARRGVPRTRRVRRSRCCARHAVASRVIRQRTRLRISTGEGTSAAALLGLCEIESSGASFGGLGRRRRTSRPAAPAPPLSGEEVEEHYTEDAWSGGTVQLDRVMVGREPQAACRQPRALGPAAAPRR